MSRYCNDVKDADNADRGWLDEQIHVAAKNLSNRPVERRGPFKVSDQTIVNLNERFSVKKP